jgi:hypothetical protein
MTDLREELFLPRIHAEIVATYLPSQTIGKTVTKECFGWEIVFAMSGPDVRYNPGVVWLNPQKVKELREALSDACQKMNKLANQSFMGTFSERLSKVGTPIVEVRAENGNAWVDFSVCSETQRFTVTLSPKDVEVILDKLMTVDQQGERMIETLRKII